MALLGAESFDLYGTNVANLLLRGYSSAGALALSTTNTRTGTGALSFFNGGQDLILIKVLDAPVNTIINSCALRIGNSPTQDYNANTGLGISNNTNAAQYKCVVNTSLGISIRIEGGTSGTELGRSANNIISVGTYFFIEFKMTRNSGGINTGIAEVRVNGAVILTINGLNIVDQFTRISVGNYINNLVFGGSYSALIDDWLWLDSSGTINNNYIGDRRCITVYPSADSTPLNWTPSSGVAQFDLINEPTPNDAGFIQANTLGNISEFQKQAISINSNDVAGVFAIARALKPDAGPCGFKIGMRSNASVLNGVEFLPNTTVSYFAQLFERDPNGNIPWTKATLDAAFLRFERSL